jgi:hypothetical protein
MRSSATLLQKPQNSQLLCISLTGSQNVTGCQKTSEFHTAYDQIIHTSYIESIFFKNKYVIGNSTVMSNTRHNTVESMKVNFITSPTRCSIDGPTSGRIFKIKIVIT